MEKESYSLIEFIREFEVYDDQRVWELEEIKALYNEIIGVYGVINSENFDVDYCIRYKELVEF